MAINQTTVKISELPIAGSANLVAANIKSGVDIFGVNGTINPFYKANGSSMWNFENSANDYLTAINGLTFTPNFIFVKPNVQQSGYSNARIGYYPETGMFYTNGLYNVGYANISITTNGFTISSHGLTNTSTFDWWAYII